MSSILQSRHIPVLNKKNEQPKRSCRCAHLSCHIDPLLQFAKRSASKGLKATLAITHYTVKSIHATTVGVEPISDGYDEGGYKQAPSTKPTYSHLNQLVQKI